MITVTEKDLIELGYGTSFTANIIREAKRLMISRGHTYCQPRKLDRVPRETVGELLGTNFTDKSNWLYFLHIYVRNEIMVKDLIKKAENETYYFRANLGFHSITGKQIQKYKSGFETKKKAREAYSKLMLASTEELVEKRQQLSFKQFIEETYLPWYKTQVKESTYLDHRSTIQKHFSYFYKMTVDEIEPNNVQNWQLELTKKFNPNYICIVQGMPSVTFDRAIALDLAKKNSPQMIGNIRSKKTKVNFWTLDEFQKVTFLFYKSDCYGHYLFISYWLLLMTRMRIGKAATL